MYDCTHKRTYGHVCSLGLTRAHTVCLGCQLCLACLFLFVCSWWPTRCCLPASTCRGCLWGFSPSAPRGKSSCKPATALRRGCDWRMRMRNRWGLKLHMRTHTHTQKKCTVGLKTTEWEQDDKDMHPHLLSTYVVKSSQPLEKFFLKKVSGANVF